MTLTEARRVTLRQFALLTNAYCQLEGKTTDQTNKTTNKNNSIQTLNF